MEKIQKSNIFGYSSILSHVHLCQCSFLIGLQQKMTGSTNIHVIHSHALMDVAQLYYFSHVKIKVCHFPNILLMAIISSTCAIQLNPLSLAWLLYQITLKFIYLSLFNKNPANEQSYLMEFFMCFILCGILHLSAVS